MEFKELTTEELYSIEGGGDDLATDIGYGVGKLFGSLFSPKALLSYKIIGIYPKR
jgi:bacteriocin-like protein